MRTLLPPSGLLLLFLQACAAPPPPLPPRLIPASLTAPCPRHQADPRTNGELLEAYVQALDSLAVCSARHRALTEAITTKGTP